MSVIKTGKTWAFRTDVGKNPVTGKRKQVYRGGFRTKKEAELAQAEFLTQVKTEGYFIAKNELMEVFMKKWLTTVYKHEVQPTTYERAERVVNLHILPAFGQCEVSAIKTYDVQQFLSNKSNSGLSPASVKIIRNVLSKAFQTAMDWELIKKKSFGPSKRPND